VDVPDAMGNPSGQVYRARRAGYIEVDNPAHARGIRAMLGDEGRVMTGVSSSSASAAYSKVWSCPSCCRTNWDHDSTCARCGKDRPSEKENGAAVTV
jgi:hypothetical protein